MPEQFGFKEKLMRTLSELSPVDRALQKRAEWLIEETGIEQHLVKNGQYLDIGTGKGHIAQHILEDMDKLNKPLKGYYGIEVADKPVNKVQKRELTRQKTSEVNEASSEKNPMGFMWATSEALPFKDASLDGISYLFSIHHMDKEIIDRSVEESKRVLKKDGCIFIAEDLVDTEEQRKITEEIDRKLNWENRDIKHNYKSDREWEEYFKNMGLEIVEKKFFESQSKKGPIKHGFYVLKIKTEKTTI